jgi:hypothetical protein
MPHETSVHTRNKPTLEALLQRGLELSAWVVVDKAPLHAKEFGVCIFDPNEFSYNEIEMSDSSYGATFEEALEKAIGRWK